MNALTTARTLTLAAVASLFLSLFAGKAHAVLFFTEEFTGATLDPAWTQIGDASGHIGLNGSGQYLMSDDFGGGETALRRNTNDSPDSFVATLDVSFSPLFSPNTQTDFNWRFFGPDGFVEVVLNSFGNIRVFSNHAGTNIGGPTAVTGFADADTLNLSLSYNQGTDTFDVRYGINGGPATDLATYTGAGNFYTNFTDARMFKFGSNDGPATASLDRFAISVIPEPSSAALVGVGVFSLLLVRRRKSRR